VGFLPLFGRFRKKPWEKVQCEYVLEEYGREGGRGWVQITEPSGEIPTMAEARENFTPGCHYRIMARSVEESEAEGIKAGKFVGVVWSHYEPLPGGVKPIKQVKTKAPPPPKDAVESVKEWAVEVRRVLEPIKTFGDAMRDLREGLIEIVGTPQQGQGVSPGEGGQWEIPPLEYDGKAPWFMHPHVASILAEEVKGVIDFAAKRFEQVIRGPSEEGAVREEGVPLLPRLSDFQEKGEEAPAIEAPSELAEAEISEAEEKEEVEEEAKEDKACLQCGRTDVELLPNGLCQDCAKNFAEAEKEKKRGKKNAAKSGEGSSSK